MESRNMNIYDIAKEAGVSISTVSRVLNHKGNVNPATRERVEEVLERNHYTPSAIARGMVSKSMRTVAVLTVDIRVPHYARTAYTIERELSHRGYEAVSYTHLDVYKRQIQIVRRLIDELSGGQRQRAYIAMVIAQDTEYVLLDEPTNNLDIYHATNLMKMVRKLSDDLGKTVIPVSYTHL